MNHTLIHFLKTTPSRNSSCFCIMTWDITVIEKYSTCTIIPYSNLWSKLNVMAQYEGAKDTEISKGTMWHFEWQCSEETVLLSILTRQEVADFLFNNPPKRTTVYEFWARWTGERKISEISIDMYPCAFMCCLDVKLTKWASIQQLYE